MASNFNGNFIGDGSGLTNVNANLLDGYDSSHFRKAKWKSFTVPGNVNTFWPVLFPVNAAGNYAEEMLELAQPNVHAAGSAYGAFYLKLGANITGWGNLSQIWRVYAYTKGGSNAYISKIRDVDHATSRIGIWLRGNTTYYYRSDSDITPTVVTTDGYYSYNHSNNSYDIIVNSTTTVDDQIWTEGAMAGLSTSVTADASGNVTIKGDLNVTGDVTAYYSDARLKDFEGTIPSALDKLSKIGGYYYTGNEKAAELGYDTEELQVGVNAQEVQAVMPEVVKPAPISDDYLTVQYERLVPLLIEAVKELSEKNDSLIEELNRIKGAE